MTLYKAVLETDLNPVIPLLIIDHQFLRKNERQSLLHVMGHFLPILTMPVTHCEEMLIVRLSHVGRKYKCVLVLLRWVIRNYSCSSGIGVFGYHILLLQCDDLMSLFYVILVPLEKDLVRLQLNKLRSPSCLFLFLFLIFQLG